MAKLEEALPRLTERLHVQPDPAAEAILTTDTRIKVGSRVVMADFTGVRQNAIPIKFEVLTWGDGRTYVTSGTGYKLAMGK